MLSVSYWESKK